jgi:hypothetical protein
LVDWKLHPLIQAYHLRSVVGEVRDAVLAKFVHQNACASTVSDAQLAAVRAQGGFSEVWLAQHKTTGDTVALKVVYLTRPGLRDEQVVRARH